MQGFRVFAVLGLLLFQGAGISFLGFGLKAARLRFRLRVWKPKP